LAEARPLKHPAVLPAVARRGNDRGFALLLVIWVLALLAVLAAIVASDSTSEAVIARNRLDSAQARALADSGIELAILHLLDPNPATRWPADGSVQQLSFNDGTIAVSLQDEGGKIDLNEAPLDFIAGLADELGVEPDARAALLNGIAARRQAFEAARKAAPPPSPGRIYFGAGTDPADLATRAFADASELRLLPGVTRAAYGRLLPDVTVYSERPTINPLTASRAVLLAVPGISPQDVEFYLGMRDRGTSAIIEKPALSGVDRYVQIAPLRTVTITARAVTAHGAVFTQQAVVSVSGNFSLRPYRILSWRQARAAGAAR
jgi:general secretion pathway protein K